MATKRTTIEVFALADKKVEAAQARLAASPVHSKEVVAKKAPVAVAKKVSFELWPDAVRGVPNAFLRSALFGVSNSRKYISGVPSLLPLRATKSSSKASLSTKRI